MAVFLYFNGIYLISDQISIEKSDIRLQCRLRALYLLGYSHSLFQHRSVFFEKCRKRWCIQNKEAIPQRRSQLKFFRNIKTRKTNDELVTIKFFQRANAKRLMPDCRSASYHSFSLRDTILQQHHVFLSNSKLPGQFNRFIFALLIKPSIFR